MCVRCRVLMISALYVERDRMRDGDRERDRIRDSHSQRRGKREGGRGEAPTWLRGTASRCAAPAGRNHRRHVPGHRLGIRPSTRPYSCRASRKSTCSRSAATTWPTTEGVHVRRAPQDRGEDGAGGDGGVSDPYIYSISISISSHHSYMYC